MGTAVGDQWLSVCNNAPLVRNQFGLRISRSRSPQPVPLDNQNVLGTICPWESIWDQFCGGQMFGEDMSLGPNFIYYLNGDL